MNYADAWADGLTRKAVLEIGRRATVARLLEHETLATEAVRFQEKNPDFLLKSPDLLSGILISY